MVRAAGRLRAGAVGVVERVGLGQRVQVRHRADVVGALHYTVAAGLDGGGAVAEVVVERVVLAIDDHEVLERREVRCQRVDRRHRLLDRRGRLAVRGGLVGDPVVAPRSRAAAGTACTLRARAPRNLALEQS